MAHVHPLWFVAILVWIHKLSMHRWLVVSSGIQDKLFVLFDPHQLSVPISRKLINCISKHQLDGKNNQYINELKCTQWHKPVAKWVRRCYLNRTVLSRSLEVNINSALQVYPSDKPEIMWIPLPATIYICLKYLDMLLNFKRLTLIIVSSYW